MKRSGFKMKGFSYPGTSPINKNGKPPVTPKEIFKAFTSGIKTLYSDVYKGLKTGVKQAKEIKKTKTKTKRQAPSNQHGVGTLKI